MASVLDRPRVGPVDDVTRREFAAAGFLLVACGSDDVEVSPDLVAAGGLYAGMWQVQTGEATLAYGRAGGGTLGPHR